MPTPDIPWLQRLGNYCKALGLLTQAVELGRARALSDIERQGLIKAFRLMDELAKRNG